MEVEAEVREEEEEEWVSGDGGVGEGDGDVDDRLGEGTVSLLPDILYSLKMQSNSKATQRCEATVSN